MLGVLKFLIHTFQVYALLSFIVIIARQFIRDSSPDPYPVSGIWEKRLFVAVMIFFLTVIVLIGFARP